MMDRIRKFQILNYQIFSIIEKYTNNLPIMEPHIQHIDPPIPDCSDYETIQNLKPPPSSENADSDSEKNNNHDDANKGEAKERISILRKQDSQDDADYDDEDFRDESEA